MSVYQKFLEDKVKEGAAPGLSAIVFDGDKTIFEGATGVHTIAGDGTAAKPMTTSTVHWMASCTKLLEKGLVKGLSVYSIDDHEALTTILPEFKAGSGSNVSKILESYGPVGSDGKRELKLRESSSKVTLRHLLTHSAGLCYYWNHPLMVEYYKPSEGEAHATLPFVTGKISDFASPAVQEAGVSMEYSPVTDWLGQFAVRATGKHLRTLLLEHIAAPLDLPTAEFDVLLKKMGNADISGVHVRGPGGNQGPDFIHIPFGIYNPEEEEPPSDSAYFASACIYSTPRTYCKVLQACLSHDSRLLKESTWKTAEGDAWNGKVKMPKPLWKTGRPDLTYDIDVFAPSTQSDGGFGMNLLQQHVATAPTLSGRPTGSYTWGGLCNTFYFVDPVSGLGSMISTQLLPFADPQLMKVKDEWEALVYAEAKKA